MKTFQPPTQYICDICGFSYNNPDDAIRCESKGRAYAPPIGMIFNNASLEKNFYDKITFCVAKTSHSHGHYCNVSLWAARDNGAGDNYGTELCGGQAGHNLKDNIRDIPDLDHPTFKRMVQYLKNENIPATVWNGKEAVPLEEFLETYKKAGDDS